MKWFDYQRQALEYLHGRVGKEDYGIFVYHRLDGRRRFVVAQWVEFTHAYLNYDAGHRHHYEVVRVNSPAKLHLDVDIKLENGEPSNGKRRLQIVLQLIQWSLKTKYNVHVEPKHVIQFDSSTPSKFSVHLIYPTVIFVDNVQCGNFVSELADVISATVFDQVQHDILNSFRRSELELLFVTHGAKRECIVDLKIYTRNRQFRIWKSAKLEKGVPLTTSAECCYPVSTPDAFLMQSFVTCVPLNSRASHLQCAARGTQNARRVSDTTTGEGSATRVPPTTSTATAVDLDEYVWGVIHSIPAYRNAVPQPPVHLPDGNTIVYRISGTRWCQHVERAHSQNRPYFCANMVDGVVYQMCHSYSCRGYRSPWIQIPVHLLGSYELNRAPLTMVSLAMTDFDLGEIL